MGHPATKLTLTPPHLHSDGGVLAKHHLHASNVALGSVAHKDLISGDSPVVKGLGNASTQVLGTALVTVAASR
jgi:hypothetical protein